MPSAKESSCTCGASTPASLAKAATTESNSSGVAASPASAPTAVGPATMTLISPVGATAMAIEPGNSIDTKLSGSLTETSPKESVPLSTLMSLVSRPALSSARSAVSTLSASAAASWAPLRAGLLMAASSVPSAGSVVSSLATLSASALSAASLAATSSTAAASGAGSAAGAAGAAKARPGAARQVPATDNETRNAKAGCLVWVFSMVYHSFHAGPRPLVRYRQCVRGRVAKVRCGTVWASYPQSIRPEDRLRRAHKRRKTASVRQPDERLTSIHHTPGYYNLVIL